jgi:hypothetical protein
VWAFTDDARKPARKRRNVGCPWPLALVHLAERFGKWPWELEDQPADRVRRYLAVMGIEGEAKAAMEGLDADEPFYRED